jgi:protein-S-isoprenylcysteine O-methyltransferase Ste14
MTATTAAVPTLGSRLARGALFAALLPAALLALAGRADRPGLIAYAAVLGAAALAAVLAIDPSLARERMRGGQRGEDPWRLAAIRILFLATFVVGLLEIRMTEVSAVPQLVQGVAVVVSAFAFAWTIWCVASNRFFVPVIRVQPERGQHVVRGGPYARVRHPGYAGMAIAAPASALAMGSWWGLAPALAVAWLFVARAAHEDRFLREHLDGYAAYAADVRWRLVPGLW